METIEEYLNYLHEQHTTANLVGKFVTSAVAAATVHIVVKKRFCRREYPNDIEKQKKCFKLEPYIFRGKYCKKKFPNDSRKQKMCKKRLQDDEKKSKRKGS